MVEFDIVQPFELPEPVGCHNRSCSQFLPIHVLLLVERMALYDLKDELKSSLTVDKSGSTDAALVMPNPRVVAGVDELLKLTSFSSILKPLI